MPRSRCVGCRRTFSSVTAFDRHQTSEETRAWCCPTSRCVTTASGVICHDPDLDSTLKPTTAKDGSTVWAGSGTRPAEV